MKKIVVFEWPVALVFHNDTKIDHKRWQEERNEQRRHREKANRKKGAFEDAAGATAGTSKGANKGPPCFGRPAPGPGGPWLRI